MRPSPRAPDTVNFNPRSREGSDERWINRIRELEEFQSTLP